MTPETISVNRPCTAPMKDECPEGHIRQMAQGLIYGYGLEGAAHLTNASLTTAINRKDPTQGVPSS
jgi:hypothetical protein